LPAERTGKKVAVVGSGPAGLACAVELNRAGHSVTVFEREDKIGGIMRYGIPDFKLEKSLLDRRIEIWKEEGVRFLTGTNAGIDLSVEKLKSEFQALVVAGGSRVPRDLKLEGRELQGIHFAMEYLVQSNRRVVGEKIPPKELIDAGGKKVVVIGGGDTGADCVGTAHRQGAACVVQIELLPQPPQKRSPQQAWPSYPFIFKSSTSHEEGGERRWSIATKKFLGKDGKIGKLACIKVDEKLNEIAGSDFEIEADLVILALGFLHPERSGLLEKLRLEHDARGNVKTDGNYMTSEKGIFSAGDMRRGQSLIVWALAEGQQAAKYIDQYLIGSSSLITK
jgi:glutamate synthase (NADPH/NADH) small chain